MNEKVLKPITETKYLSAENAWRYRSIMRFFYQCDQKFRHWLYKEDVYNELIKHEYFKGYTIDQCKQDLDSLVTWGNLNAVQDSSKVKTYQQFINKQFRYQMTEYSIEIERMTIRLENIFIEGASLEPTLLERIKNELMKMKTLVKGEDKELGMWWSNLSADFQRLNQNYQDYIRDWYGLKAEEMMKTKSFLIYKEKLVDYLRDFVKELQQHSQVIESILRDVEEQEEKMLIEKVSAYEMTIPRIDIDKITIEEITENIQGKYDSFKSFFFGTRGRESEVEKVMSMTNEIIRRITRYAASILEMTNQFSSRKEDYKNIASMFVNCTNIEDAHKLSAYIFGIERYKHFKSNDIRETESINSMVFEEKPSTVIVNPRIRTYREKSIRTAIRERTEEKEQMKKEILAKRKAEKEIVNSYIKDGIIDFKNLDILKPYVRTTFLRWLAKAMYNSNQKAVTEDGAVFKIINPKEKEMCLLKCEDGELLMPAYIIKFEG